MGAVVFQHPRPGAESTALRARADGDVVVELEIAHAQLTDEEIDGLVQMRHRGRVAQVKVTTGLLDHAPPAAGEERLVR